MRIDMKIVLMRHGRPEATSTDAVHAYELVHWISAYNEASVAKDSIPTNVSLSCAAACNVVLCSSLRRSEVSAQLLRDDYALVPDPQLIEAGLPWAEWKLFKLKPKYWAVVFRVMWYFGYSKHAESIKAARSRAHTAALGLVELAGTHGSVLFVGHGIFNRLVATELRKLGWSGPANPGSGYWDFGVYRSGETKTA